MFDIIKIIIVGVAVIVGISAPFIYRKFKDDNIVEEAAEMVIEEAINVDVDLTPDSPEEDADE